MILQKERIVFVSIFEAIFLGMVQGLTEFLPVSSSGHLVISQYFLGVKEPGVTFEVLVHFGTLFSVIWVFWKDITNLFLGFSRQMQQRKLMALLAISIIPTGLMGVFLGPFFKGLYENVTAVGFMLLVTGLILWLIERLPVGTKNIKKMGVSDALLISLAQGFAIIPGISRSGSTITAALARNLDMETAVRFSFLMSLPVIFGATIMEARDIFSAGSEHIYIIPYAIATVTAFFAGIVAIKTFIKLLKARKFRYFSYYCWFMGTLVIIISLTGYF